MSYIVDHFVLDMIPPIPLRYSGRGNPLQNPRACMRLEGLAARAAGSCNELPCMHSLLSSKLDRSHYRVNMMAIDNIDPWLNIFSEHGGIYLGTRSLPRMMILYLQRKCTRAHRPTKW